MMSPDHHRAKRVHEAVYYQDADDLVALTAPMLRRALEHGVDVALVCEAHNNRALVEALGDDNRVVTFPPRPIYRKAISAIGDLREFVESRLAQGSHRVCILGEVDFGTHGAGLDEWRRYEALVNHVMTDLPLWTVCAYPTSMPHPVLATADLTHPYLRQLDVRLINPNYVDPAELMRLADSTAELVPLVDPDLTIPQVLDLQELHQQVNGLLASAGMAEAQRRDMIMAVHELVTNGMRHGEPPVSVEMWALQGRAVCIVTDKGQGFEDPFAGYQPGDGSPLPQAAFGLWLARQLCDELVTARTPDGFVVRLVAQYSPGRRIATSAP